MSGPSSSPTARRRARFVLAMLGGGALAALAAAVATRGPGHPASPPVVRLADPVVATLLRCQTLGDAGLADAGCRAAWAEHRRRFLAREHRP